MGQYTNKGLYNAYKKNNKERDALDYYATPTKEVLNILKETGIYCDGKTILEPCVGGGHMCEGINQYLQYRKTQPEFDPASTPTVLLGSDIQDRGYRHPNWQLTYGVDFLADDYPIDKADIIIMNPPYATLEPFLIRALEIAQECVVVLTRTQALEGSSRFNKIFKDNPPDAIYQYVERIQCYKNGKVPEGSSAQAYCWMVWDSLPEWHLDQELVKQGVVRNYTITPSLHWIHRVE